MLFEWRDCLSSIYLTILKHPNSIARPVCGRTLRHQVIHDRLSSIMGFKCGVSRPEKVFYYGMCFEEVFLLERREAYSKICAHSHASTLELFFASFRSMPGEIHSFAVRGVRQVF